MKVVYDQNFAPKVASEEHQKVFKYTQAPTFEVHQGDLLAFDWSYVDVVLINSTCFDHAFMLQIAEKASLMKPGSFMITLTKKLPTADPYHIRDAAKREWECVYSIKKNMSWGLATVNIQRRLSEED